MENSICIRLDASLKATLDWEKFILEASKIAELGSKILWKLDFGLFDHLQHALSSQSQFQSFRLAIEHFHNIIWSQFAEASLGALLYEGPLDCIDCISQETIREWADARFEKVRGGNLEDDAFFRALFCRDVALDYLKQLAEQLPFGVNSFIQPFVSMNMTPVEKAIFFNPECYRPFLFCEGFPTPSSENIGICLPSITQYCSDSYHQLDAAVQKLAAEGKFYRFIAEEALMAHIEGLDELFVAPMTLSLQGKRLLQGFSAAGGLIHFLQH